MTMHRELGLSPRSSAPRVARGLVHELGSQAGLPDRVTASIDSFVTIPMSGRTESLNVSMAAAVLCFETARQRRMAEA